MRIGIDISQTAFPGTGVAVYTENLVRSLLAIDKVNEYWFFFSSLRNKNPNLLLNTKNFIFPPIFLECLWNRLHIFPVDRLIGTTDIFHSSDWLEPPARCLKVTTIHDLAVYKYPETFAVRGGHDIVGNQKRKLEWVKKESKLIIAVSENTKKDIVDLLGIPENRIRVVYEAADPIYGCQCSADNVQQVRKKYGIEGKFVLAVGTREPRKNIGRIIKAFSNLQSDLTLVIAGKYGWGEDAGKIENHSPQAKIKILGYVAKEDLACLYTEAECFVYPSLYEGFGLPVLEAMTCGCPVVTSDVSSLPEVSGNAAILVDPLDVNNIAEGIEKAIKNRRELVKKSRNRAKEFSWEKTARETLEVYQEVYDHRD